MNSNGVNGTAVHETKPIYEVNQPALHNQEAENGVLGSILRDTGKLNEVIGNLRPEQFYREANGRIYRAMLNLYERSEPIDTITVTAELIRNGHGKDKEGGERYLYWLQSIVPAGANITAYALIVEENATRRGLIKTANQLSEMAYRVDEPIMDLLNEAETAVLSLQKGKTSDLLVTQDEVASAFIDDLLRDDPPGLATGYMDLDRLIGGLEPGCGYWFCAAEKIGKTSFVNGISLANARKGKVVLRISAEMDAKLRMRRDVAAITRIPIEKLKRRDLTEQERNDAFAAVELLRSLPLVTAEKPGIRPHEVKAALNQAYRKYGQVDLIEVDYWQKLEPDRGRDNNSGELEEISKALHNIIKDRRMAVPLIGTAQVLSKAISQRQNKRPQESDVFGSSSLMKDAYLMAYLYRDDYYNPDTTQRPNIAEVDVRLHRDGPTGVIDLYWHGPTATFRNLQRQEIVL